VGRDADPHLPRPQLLHLAEIHAHGLLAEALKTTAGVGHVQENELDACRVGGLDRGKGFR
jgi:hypothetical protein